MKSIVSFQLLNNPVSTIKPDLDFIKLFFKNNILTSKDSSNVEKNLVLDTLLTGLSISPVAVSIVATDSIIQAFGKLQGTINILTSSMPADISDLTDTTGIIPTNTSDLTNDSGFIVIGDVPNTIVTNDDVDDTNIAIGKILQVGADGVTHEYVDPPTSGGSLRRSETFYAPSYISYLAFAPTGSLETDAVWTITKRVGSADGTIVSNVQYVNKKWSERTLL